MNLPPKTNLSALLESKVSFFSFEFLGLSLYELTYFSTEFIFFDIRGSCRTRVVNDYWINELLSAYSVFFISYKL